MARTCAEVLSPFSLQLQNCHRTTPPPPLYNGFHRPCPDGDCFFIQGQTSLRKFPVPAGKFMAFTCSPTIPRGKKKGTYICFLKRFERKRYPPLTLPLPSQTACFHPPNKSCSFPRKISPFLRFSTLRTLLREGPSTVLPRRGDWRDPPTLRRSRS